MGNRPTLPAEVRATLPPAVQAYITAMEEALSHSEAALSAAVGEARTLQLRVRELEASEKGVASRSSGTSLNGPAERRAGKLAVHRGWPPGFIEGTAGAWQGEPPSRPDQGEYEEREPLA